MIAAFDPPPLALVALRFQRAMEFVRRAGERRQLELGRQDQERRQARADVLDRRCVGANLRIVAEGRPVDIHRQRRRERQLRRFAILVTAADLDLNMLDGLAAHNLANSATRLNSQESMSLPGLQCCCSW